MFKLTFTVEIITLANIKSNWAKPQLNQLPQTLFKSVEDMRRSNFGWMPAGYFCSSCQVNQSNIIVSGRFFVHLNLYCIYFNK